LKAGKINITETVESARKLLETDKKISPAVRAMFNMLLMIITLLAGKLGLNSQNLISRQNCTYVSRNPMN
jgi:transposase